MRKIKRNIAKENMRKQGFTRLFKKDYEGKSTFSKNWKNYV